MNDSPAPNGPEHLDDERFDEEEPTLEHSDQGLWQSNQRPRRWPWLVAVLVLGAALFYFYYLTKEPPATETPATQSTESAAPAPRESPQEAPDLPALDASDDYVRQALSGLSADPRLRGWLQGEDLVRRFTLAVLGVAEGRSPLRQWPALAPEDPFTPDEIDGEPVLGESSWRRFDPAIDLIEAVDTAAAARVVRTLEPLLESAWRELGFQNEPFSEGVARALRRLRDAPQPEGPLRLQQAAIGWHFADPELESLRPIQKLLLRIGPRNRQRLLDKIEAIAAGAGLLSAND